MCFFIHSRLICFSLRLVSSLCFVFVFPFFLSCFLSFFIFSFHSPLSLKHVLFYLMSSPSHLCLLFTFSPLYLFVPPFLYNSSIPFLYPFLHFYDLAICLLFYIFFLCVLSFSFLPSCVILFLFFILSLFFIPSILYPLIPCSLFFLSLPHSLLPCASPSFILSF